MKKSIMKLLAKGYRIVDFDLALHEFKQIIKGSKVALVYEGGVKQTLKYNEFVDGSFGDLIAFKKIKPCKLTPEDLQMEEARDAEIHQQMNFQSREQFDETVRKEVIKQHPLYKIFVAAIEQLIWGKGERHGGGTVPFLDQPWKSLADQHGIGFLSGQASKKIGEAIATKTGDDRLREVLGAVNYAGMTALYHQMTNASSKPTESGCCNHNFVGSEDPGLASEKFFHGSDIPSKEEELSEPIEFDEFKVRAGDFIMVVVNGDVRAGFVVPEKDGLPLELNLKFSE